MSQSKFYFMLPNLVTKGLVPDDSMEYALLTYPRDVISQSAILIVKDYSTRLTQIDFSTKKRVKIVMENLAVALSLRIEHVGLMSTARTIYRKWLENPSIFGDNKRQNKYLRRIIKQLSLPFAIRSPEDVELFKGEFNTLLNAILNDYRYIHTTRGADFEKETWVTMFNVMIGIADVLITFDFTDWLSKADSSKLRQKAVDACFSVLELSGLKDDDLWKRLNEYSIKWSNSVDFIKVWGRECDKLFVFVTFRIFKLPIESTVFQEGVYSQTKPISDEMASFIFHNVIFDIDVQKSLADPDLLKEVTLAVSRLTQNASAFGEMQGVLFSKKYPALSFLQLFGKYLTFAPILNEKFDDAVSFQVDAILTILSSFELDPDSEIALKLLAYISKRLDHDHIHAVGSFLSRACVLYRQCNKSVPFISRLAIKLMNEINPTRNSRFSSEQFYTSIIGLFQSSSTYLIGLQNAEIKEDFNIIWNLVFSHISRYPLLCTAWSFDVDLYDKLAILFTDTPFKALISDPSNAPLLIGIISYIGMLPRYRSDFNMDRAPLITSILQTLPRIDPKRFENYDDLTLNVLTMLINVIEYADYLIQIDSIVDIVFDYLKNLETTLSGRAIGWRSEQLHAARYLIKYIFERINARFPDADSYSHVLWSSNLISEDNIAKVAGLEDYTTHYFTMGENRLFSFVEQNDGRGPLILMMRGPYGKAIWQLSDDFQSTLPMPEFSDEIKKEELPKFEPVPPRELPHLQKPIVTASPLSDFEQADSALRDSCGPLAKDWLDWSKLANYDYVTKGASYQRPRVIDFLTETGLVGRQNIKSIRPQTDLEKVQKSIAAYDSIHQTAFSVIPVIHIFETDSSLAYTKDAHNTMTPALSEFMKEVAEPMEIKAYADLPPLKTNIPVISGLHTDIGFVTPAMATEESGRQQIYELANTSLVKIIFNESGFQLKLQSEKRPKQIILVIEPKGHGIYHVIQAQLPRNVLSPFMEESTMFAKDLAFNIAALAENGFFGNKVSTILRNSKERLAAITPLTDSKVDDIVGAKLCDIFSN